MVSITVESVRIFLPLSMSWSSAYPTTSRLIASIVSALSRLKFS